MIARQAHNHSPLALVIRPSVRSVGIIMRLLLTVVRSEGIAALVATHDEALMDLADEVLRLEDGHIVS